jgi:hypothetical protein
VHNPIGNFLHRQADQATDAIADKHGPLEMSFLDELRPDEQKI